MGISIPRGDHNLVPRAHVPFGQHQDTELWNNQFPETKILGLPASRRMCGLVYRLEHSRPQSLRSFWPAAGIESSGSNHYERTKEITEFWLSGSLRICIYGACLKRLLPELSIPAAGQKDRRLWGRECV